MLVPKSGTWGWTSRWDSTPWWAAWRLGSISSCDPCDAVHLRLVPPSFKSPCSIGPECNEELEGEKTGWVAKNGSDLKRRQATDKRQGAPPTPGSMKAGRGSMCLCGHAGAWGPDQQPSQLSLLQDRAHSRAGKQAFVVTHRVPGAPRDWPGEGGGHRVWLRGSHSTNSRQCRGGSMTQRHFQTRTLGTRVTDSGGKGKVSSEVSDRDPEKRCCGQEQGFWGVRRSWGPFLR